MTPEQEHNLVLRLCHGNTEAIDWTQRMNEYAHLIDDIVDEDLLPEGRIVCQNPHADPLQEGQR